MGVIWIALQILGVTADTVQLGEGIKILIEREKNCPPEKLFTSCFGHALKRLSSALAAFEETQDAKRIAIDSKNLDRAVAEMDDNYTASISTNDPTETLHRLAPKFRDAVIIPGHQLVDDEFDRQVEKILGLTFDLFIMELPAHSTAFRTVELEHIIKSGYEHHEQQQALDRIVGILERIAEKQLTLERERPELTPTMVQLESTRPEFRNPFRIVTAENFDHDYRRLAQLFMQPSDYDHIRGHENLLVAGGRGCGKSMILKSMAAIPAVEIERLRRDTLRMGRVVFSLFQTAP